MLIAQLVATICLVAVGVILTKKLHDKLPSRLRTDSASVVSALARIILIPASLFLTGIAGRYDIFLATYILLGIVGVSIVAFLFIQHKVSSVV